MRNLGQPPPDAPPGPPGDDEADESLAGAIGSEGAGSSGGASLTDEKWPEVLIIPRQTKIDQRQTRYTRISMDSTYVHYGCDCGGTVKFNRGGDKTGLAQKRNEHERNKKQHKDWLANGGTTTAAAPAPAGPSSQGGALVSHQAKRQRTDTSSFSAASSSSNSSAAMVLYVPTGNLTEAHCTALKKIIPNGFNQALFDFLSQMPAAQVDGWLVQMDQASSPDEAEKLVKGWKDDYHKELKKNGSEDLQKRQAEFRKAKREVQDTALRLQKSTLTELDAEISKAGAQRKELEKRGFADPGPCELCSQLRSFIDVAIKRQEAARVQSCKPEAQALATRMETAPSSLVWNHETLEQLKPQGDLAKAFHLLGKAHLLPTLRDPEPVMVWNRKKLFGGSVAYANQICCTFDTVTGPQNVWAMQPTFARFFEAIMDDKATWAKFDEITQRAEAGEFPVDTDPTPPTNRTVQELPPLNPQPAGVRAPSHRRHGPARHSSHAYLALMSEPRRCGVCVHVLRVRNRTRLWTR
mmetsp:Transcript_81720/g.162629  ORF Transcript_81720/g.162629 Transcript_81720/m.162629 type:complete len:523 (-) Transcript_81720:1014-2582(-)